MRARRGWRRWVMVGAVCVCAGVVVNVVVAWGCVLWAPFDPHQPGLDSVAPPPWPREVPSDWPSNPALVHAWKTRCLEYSDGVVVEPPAVGSNPRIWSQQVLGGGWPFVSLESESRIVHDGSGGSWRDWRWGVRAPLWIPSSVWRWERGMLPLRPVMPGFLVDTVFYGALAAGAFWMCRDARSSIRRRAGRCEACGYDLRGLAAGAACPECGPR